MGLPWTTTRSPSASGVSALRNRLLAQVRLSEISADGSRNVTNAVAVPGRTEIWVTCPSIQIEPSRLIHSAILRATVRTGQGVSALVGGCGESGSACEVLAVRIG